MTKQQVEWAVEDLKRQGFHAWVEKVAKHSNGYAVAMEGKSGPRRFFSREEVKAFLKGVA